MILTEQERIEFDDISHLMIKWLCDHCHPHVSVIITSTNAELLEGVASTGEIMDYVHD